MSHTESPLQRVQTSFERQGLMRHWGAQIERVESGLCVLSLPYSDKVTQQQDGFHGGAMGALADIAAGYAGLTQAPAGMEVVTVEYKINFLSACQGGKLLATGRVIKAGKRVLVTSAEVLHVADDGRETVCSALPQSLMTVPKTY
jgi:uncharacterized protein (TIGR00369 family)